MTIPLAIIGVAFVLSKVFLVKNGVSGTSGYRFLLFKIGVAVRIDKSYSFSAGFFL
jgi:membrane-bound ClpP family serine protease